MLFSRFESKPVRKYIDTESEETVYYFLRQNLYVWIDGSEKNITGLAGWSNYFDAVLIRFKEYNEHFPSEILIENPRIRMVLTLNLLGH